MSDNKQLDNGTSQKKNVSNEKGRAFYLAIILLICGLGGTFSCFLEYFLPYYSTGNWQEVVCTVISIQVKDISDEGKGLRYSPNIKYSYEFNGNEYISDSFDFFSFSSPQLSDLKKIVMLYSQGEQYLCYVNPANPEEAILTDGFSLSSISKPFFFTAICLSMLLFGIGCLIYSFRNNLTEEKNNI